MVSCIFLSLQFLADFIEITFRGKFMEGYGYAIYLFLFDVSIVIPLILLLISKDRFLIIWSVLTVVSLNLTTGFGWQWGSFSGVLFTIGSILIVLLKKKDVIFE